uniref:Uncharacterized protein LOC108038610 n=1 Tax=Drosophila rhopaloa TaxID=1041015 RepID=A0A6P4EC91_DRORH
MSSVSLEEIFMSFGAEDLDYRKSGGADNKDDSYDDGEDQDENVQNCRSQWRAMMTKKWLSLYDNKVYFLLLMLIPIVYYLSTLISATDPHSLARVSMNVEGYGDYGVTILVSDSGKSGEMRPAYYTISRMAGKDVELKVIRDPVEGYVKSALATP